MNKKLDEEPTADEVWAALSEMHPLKAPGPDEMHGLFYKKCWEFVGMDVVNFVKKAWHGHVSLTDVNKTRIVLVPKVKEPCSVTQYRPISLCNVLYKILAKTMANCLKDFLPAIISEQQTAFVPNRLITDNALVALEVFHYMKKKTRGRRGVCAIKLDMSKAYD